MRKHIKRNHSLIYQGECWFNKFPEGVNAERIWISPPSFFYGKDWSLLHRASHMEEIYPICLAQQDSQRAAPHLRQYSGSKHFKAQWWRTDSELPVFNKELHWNLRRFMCSWGNLPLSKDIKTTWWQWLFWITKESCVSTAWSLTVFFRNHAIGSSDYRSTAACTSLIPQVGPIFLYLSSRLENSKNPWLQYTAGRQTSRFKLFTGTTGIQAM